MRVDLLGEPPQQPAAVGRSHRAPRLEGRFAARPTAASVAATSASGTVVTTSSVAGLITSNGRVAHNRSNPRIRSQSVTAAPKAASSTRGHVGVVVDHLVAERLAGERAALATASSASPGSSGHARGVGVDVGVAGRTPARAAARRRCRAARPRSWPRPPGTGSRRRRAPGSPAAATAPWPTSRSAQVRLSRPQRDRGRREAARHVALVGVDVRREQQGELAHAARAARPGSARRAATCRAPRPRPSPASPSDAAQRQVDVAGVALARVGLAMNVMLMPSWAAISLAPVL